jgi:hypothetical protein
MPDDKKVSLEIPHDQLGRMRQLEELEKSQEKKDDKPKEK